MKVTALAIASLAVITDASSMSGQAIFNRMASGKKEGMLRKAFVLEERKLQNNYQQNYQQYQENNYEYAQYNANGNAQYNGMDIDGSYSIKFESCTSLKILNDETLEQANNGQYGGGALDSSKDYVIFTASNNYNTRKYAVDIPTFTSSMMTSILAENEAYCEVCAEAQNQCLYQTYGNGGNSNQNANQNEANYVYANQNNAYQMSNEDGGNRRRMENSNQEPIDCATCAAICQQDQNQYQNAYTTEEAAEWLETMGQCTQVQNQAAYSNGGQNYYNNEQAYYQNGGQQQQQQQQAQEEGGNNYNNGYYNMYASFAGLMCNADGTGMEIGLFKDEYCTMWDSASTYSSMLAENSAEYMYFKKTKKLVQYIFTQSISCLSSEYINPYEYNDQNGQNMNYQDYQDQQQQYYYGKNYYYQNNNGGYGAEANDGCQALIGDGAATLVSGSCYNANGEDNNMYYQGDNGNGYQKFGEFSYYNNDGWTTYYYDIQDPDDSFQVCTAIQKQISEGQYQHTNTQPHSSDLYKYGTDDTSVVEKVKSSLTSWEIAAIVVGCIIGFLCLLIFMRVCWVRRQRAQIKVQRTALISAGQPIA